MDPNAPLSHCGRNPSRGRPRTRSHGDVEGVIPISLRHIHQFAPYLAPSLPPRASPASPHSLSHGASFPRRPRRSNTAPQLDQGGWPLMPPSRGTTLGPIDGIQHPLSINTGFTDGVSAEWYSGTLSIAAENREGWGSLMWNASSEPGKFTPLVLLPIARYFVIPSWLYSALLLADPSSVAPLPSDDGPSSVQQEGILSSTMQGQFQSCPYTGINIPIPHPAANATDPPSNVRTTIQETEQVFVGHTSTHPSVITEWVQPFNEWLPTRRQQMSVQRLGDPLACRPIWAGVFSDWYQLRQMLSSRGVGDFTVIPHCRNWNEVFDLWLQQLLEPNMQGLDASHTSPHATISNGSSAFSTPTRAAPNALLSPPNSTPPGRKARKRIPNAPSKLTVPEIQESCRRNGAEENVIARIAVVFPDVVIREHLKLAGQSGDHRDHRGYMEFAERCMVPPVKKRNGGTGGTGKVQRYKCKLCGQTKRPRWKNSKDLLDHVWDTHCDPQGDGKPFLLLRNAPETDVPYTAE